MNYYMNIDPYPIINGRIKYPAYQDFGFDDDGIAVSPFAETMKLRSMLAEIPPNNHI